MEKLHTIQMEGNPVWSSPDYTNYVVSSLKHVKVLDQQEITADLRTNAAKWKASSLMGGSSGGSGGASPSGPHLSFSVVGSGSQYVHLN